MRLCCRHYLSVPEISGEQAEFMPGMKYIYGGGGAFAFSFSRRLLNQI